MEKNNLLLTFSILTIMFLVTFAYLITLTINAILMVNEMEDVKSNYMIVYKGDKPESKVASIQSEPKPNNIVKIPAKPIAKKEPVVDKDTYLLAQIINAEAKGEPYNGKVAVGNVVMNRVEHPKFPDTLKEVIFQKGQFQPVANGKIYNKPDDEALKAAKDVMNGKKIVGSQALFFYNPDISTSSWIFTRKTLIEIGNHRFAM